MSVGAILDNPAHYLSIFDNTGLISDQLPLVHSGASVFSKTKYWNKNQKFVVLLSFTCHQICFPTINSKIYRNPAALGLSLKAAYKAAHPQEPPPLLTPARPFN